MYRIISRLLLLGLLCVSLTSCDKADEHIGEVKTPSNSDTMSGRNYQEVVEIFEEEGFTNVKLEKLEDLVTGWLTKDGEVENVSIGGDDNYSPDVWVPADSEVIIYYHTFSSSNDETETENSETSEPEDEEGFWDFLYAHIDEFEFELHPGGASYALSKYNYLSPDASEQVVIPSTYEGLPVTEIKEQAFYACEAIEHVIIPDSVTNIGSYAFFHCGNLKSIDIPESVTKIKEYAFEGCDGLTELYLSHAVDIGFRAFYDCANLKTVTMGTETDGGYVAVDGSAFQNCNSLQSVTLGPCVYAIESGAFSHCKNLKTVTLSAGLTKIGDSAFEYCESLESLNFDGTSDEWLAIDFWSWWNKDTGDYKENILK